MDVTLDLVLTVSNSKECPRTFSAVRCPHCHSEQIVTRGKTRRGTQRSFIPLMGMPTPGIGHLKCLAQAKRHTQTIERQPRTLRTRLKRLVRKTISCSETRQLHDIVMGLLVHCSAFGRTVSQWSAPL